MVSPLLMTKVHIPPMLPTVVMRPRLLKTLDADLAQRRVTLLSAPAGYGKTTLIAAWIAYRRARDRDESPTTSLHTSLSDQHTHFAWYALEDDDNDIVRFLTYLAVSLQHIDPEASEDCLVALQSHRPPRYSARLASLLKDFDARRSRVALGLEVYN